MDYPFNCKALMGSGPFWQGHLPLLTFLTQFPRKLLFMCTWSRRQIPWEGETGVTQGRLLFGHVSVAVFMMVITG